MPKELSRPPAPTSANGRDPARAWEAIQAHLESAKIKVLKEIERYPSPITACDAQFNYLLEMRDGLSQELRNLDAARSKVSPPEDPAQAAQRFIDSSRYIDSNDAAGLSALAAPAESMR